MSIDDPIAIELTDDEIRVLCSGLNEWRGPARCTDQMAVAMGFEGLDDLFSHAGERIYRAVADRQPMPQRDWVRALLATEIVFASDVMGSGHDWLFTTGSRTRTRSESSGSFSESSPSQDHST